MQLRSFLASHHTATFDWRSRAKASLIHLGLSALAAALAALLVFALWYPEPYRVVSGGRDLFQLVVTVDVILGPMITFAVFDRAKPRAVMRRDFVVVGLLQLAALCYGLWTVHIARPVHMVFEYDRFRVVHQIDLPPDASSKAPAGIDAVPWGRPTVLALRRLSDQERVDFTISALQGGSLSARPELWQPYDQARDRVLAAAMPVPELMRKRPALAAELEKSVQALGRPAADLKSLPLVARKDTAWTVLLDARSGEIVGYAPVDSF